MAIEQYPGAGITTIRGRQGSPIATTEAQSYPQGFEQAEQPLGTQSVEDTIISLYRTNTPIDVISLQVGVPSDHVAAVINQHQQQQQCHRQRLQFQKYQKSH